MQHPVIPWCTAHLEWLGEGAARATYAHPYDRTLVIKVPKHGQWCPPHCHCRDGGGPACIYTSQQEREIRALRRIQGEPFCPRFWSETFRGVLLIHQERLTPLTSAEESDLYDAAPVGNAPAWLGRMGFDGFQVGRNAAGVLKPYDLGFTEWAE